VYTTTAVNAAMEGDKITVTVTDNPDNLTIEEKLL
jgi:hypothetical protein